MSFRRSLPGYWVKVGRCFRKLSRLLAISAHYLAQFFFTVAHPFVRWKAEFSENFVGNLKNVVK